MGFDPSSSGNLTIIGNETYKVNINEETWSVPSLCFSDSIDINNFDFVFEETKEVYENNNGWTKVDNTDLSDILLKELPKYESGDFEIKYKQGYLRKTDKEH